MELAAPRLPTRPRSPLPEIEADAIHRVDGVLLAWEAAAHLEVLFQIPYGQQGAHDALPTAWEAQWRCLCPAEGREPVPYRQHTTHMLNSFPVVTGHGVAIAQLLGHRYGLPRTGAVAWGQRLEKRHPAGISCRAGHLAPMVLSRLFGTSSGADRGHQTMSIGMPRMVKQLVDVGCSTALPAYITTTSSHSSATTPDRG